MFARLSLKFKMIAAFLLVACFLPIVGGIGLYYSKQVAKTYNQVSQVGVTTAEIFSALQSCSRGLLEATLTMGLASANATDVEEASGKVDNSMTIFKNSVEQLLSDQSSDKEKALVGELKQRWDVLSGHSKTLIGLAKKGDAEKVKFNQILRNDFKAAEMEYYSTFGKLTDMQGEKSDMLMGLAENQSKTGSFINLGIIVAGFFLAALIGILFATSLAKTLGQMATHLYHEAEAVNVNSDHISQASQLVSSGATEAAASLAEVAASFDKIAQMTKANTDSASAAAALSGESSHSAGQGEKEIKTLIESMGEISKSSKKISDIIDVIDDIAFQTNLLALNAAVEAARAGEQGRGFAVVADAVRNLAQKSAAAAKDISVLIQETVAKVDRGAKIADRSGVVLNNIVTSIEKVAKINSEISVASNEQASGIEQISLAIGQLDETTQRNATASEEMASSSKKMSSQAVVLSQQAELLNTILRGVAQQKLAEIAGDENKYQRRSNSDSDYSSAA